MLRLIEAELYRTVITDLLNQQIVDSAKTWARCVEERERLYPTIYRKDGSSFRLGERYVQENWSENKEDSL